MEMKMMDSTILEIPEKKDAVKKADELAGKLDQFASEYAADFLQYGEFHKLQAAVEVLERVVKDNKTD